MRLTPLLLTWKKTRGKREKKNEGNSSLRLPLAPAFLLTATHPEKNRHEKLRMSSVTPLMAGALLMLLLLLLLFTNDP